MEQSSLYQQIQIPFGGTPFLGPPFLKKRERPSLVNS